jgi:hypothetical protein
MNEAKKKTNKFFYCFKQYYNFQTGILKRGNSLLGADHISPNFLFNILSITCAASSARDMAAK